MRRYETVKSKQDFENNIHNGKFKKNKYYVIYYLPNNLSYNRYGIAVSKKLGHAFLRNKLKRQVRNIIHDSKNMFSKSQDYIIMIRKSYLDLEYSKMLIEFQNLIKEK